jgi:hypothetical protein
VAGLLRLKREGVGMELHRGPFEIKLDGTDVGTIKWHETLELPIQAGRHTLRLLSGRYSSRSYSFEVPDEEVANIQCHGAMMWPRYVISLVKPDWAISLRGV